MRTVVVTGSASGIGRATAEILHARGDRVVGVDLHDADVVADLSVTTGRQELALQVEALTGGRIDAIVANAGLAHPSPTTVAVNFFGAVATLEGLRPLLRHSDAPRAVTTCSMASLMPVDDELVTLLLAGDEHASLERAAKLVEANGGRTIYSSTKRALAMWLRRSAPSAAWAGAGIPLNAIGPGIVSTPMVRDMIATPEGKAALLEQVPMPLNGIMTADVPAKLLVWLVSEENSHLCGQVVFVDGGSDAVLRGDSTW